MVRIGTKRKAMKSAHLSSLVVLLLLTCFTTSANAQCSITANLVSNGNFESGNTGFSSSYAYSSGNLVAEGKYDVLTNPRTDHASFATCTDHTSGTGKMMVLNAATTAGVSVWCQTVSVSANSAYTFSTWIASVVGSNPAVLQFSINGVNLGTPFTASTSTCNWQQFCETWNSGASTSANICIVNQNTAAGGNDFALDDIQMGLTAVLFVSIHHFTASNFDQGTHLQWSASIDNEHDYFAIEKSEDLVQWREIAKVYGKGAYADMADYEYFDLHKKSSSAMYYRLRNVSKNGEETYSTVKSITAVKSEISICPNPTYDKCYILGAKHIKVIEVYNSLEVEQKRIVFSEHPDPIEIDFSDLKAGIYFIKIYENENEQHIIRLIKR